MDARTLARLAAQFAGRGVVGFGLSNDERRGPAEEFERAFGIAGRAGLLLVPHGGELLGPASVTATLDRLRADRIGHGVRAAEDPEVVKRLAAAGVTLEICPSSNVALGVLPDAAAVPVRALFESGVPIALGADDPLLFGRRLITQYQIARDVHAFTPRELADLARMSVLGSVAPASVRARLLAGIDAWLRQPEEPAARLLCGFGRISGSLPNVEVEGRVSVRTGSAGLVGHRLYRWRRRGQQRIHGRPGTRRRAGFQL